jgi:hypothetical protein
MAKRKYSAKRTNKIQPAVQTLYLVTPSVSQGASGSSYVDLSQIASLVNRRFYRQGINWAVAGFKFLTAEPTPGNTLIGSVTVEKLPNTWVMSNAWEKSMRTWNKMNREALAEAPSVRPKFLDFKIYADSGHHSSGFGDNLLPYTASGVATAGEWQPSKFVVPDTTSAAGGVNNFEVIATGASFPGGGNSGLNAVSLIEGYANSRGLPYTDDPNVPDDVADANGPTPENWLSAIFNEGTNQDDQVLDDMRTENDQAPYPFENDGINNDTMYPGGGTQLSGLQIHDSSSYGATTIGGTTRIKGGNFPCGLVKITHAVSNESQAHSLAMIIDLVPGNHRGYLCEPMTEM